MHVLTRGRNHLNVTTATKFSQILEVTSGISAFTQALNPLGAKTVGESSHVWTVTRTTFVFTQGSVRTNATLVTKNSTT